MVERNSAYRVLALAAVLLPAAAVAQPEDPYVDYRSRQVIDIKGAFRDFDPYDQATGHPDFGAIALDGYGRFAQVPEEFLDPASKPEYNTSGFQVLEPWRDADGNYLMPLPPTYVSTRPGDVAGQLDPVEAGAVSGPTPFSQWFRDSEAYDTAGVEGFMRLSRVVATDNYLFEGFLDGAGTRTGAAQPDTNATYTYEFETTFIYEDDRDYYIAANSHGDFWIYLDDRLVLDGGAGSSVPVNYAGIIVDGTVSMENSALVDLEPGTEGQVNTNATGPNAVFMKNQAKIAADVNVGFNGEVSDINPTQGAQITGTKGVLTESIPMPPLPPVPEFGASDGDYVKSGGAPSLNGDYHVDDFILRTNAMLRVTGPTRIVVDGTFEIGTDSQVELNDGATLEFHVTNGGIFMGNNASMNLGQADPGLVTFYNHSSSQILMDNGFEAYANFVSPHAEMKIANGIHLYGSFFGKNLVMTNTSKFTMMGRKEPILGWGEGEELEGAQRIDLDRLSWLQHDRTYRLKIFFSDRVIPKSQFRMQTNIMTLNLANAAKDLAKVD